MLKAKSKKPEVKEQTELDKAATKIQAGFRGHQTRQQHKNPKVHITQSVVKLFIKFFYIYTVYFIIH